MDLLKSLLAKLRLLRRRGARVAGLPPEALSKIDAAIEIIQHAIALPQAGLEVVRAA